MKEFGGYFEISGLIQSKEWHSDANICLNSATNAIIFCIKNRGYDGIYLPYYNCDVVRKKIINSGIKVKYYSLNEDFYPKIKSSECLKNFGFLYVDYFGINYINSKKVCTNFKNVIIDNSQAFFSKRIDNIDSVYSPRKFFCTVDGSYLYSDVVLGCDSIKKIKYDNSYKGYSLIFKRLELDASMGYDLHKEYEHEVEKSDLKLMSKSTKYILSCIDYEKSILKRKENFDFLHSELSDINYIKIDIKTIAKDELAPMVYPFLVTKDIRGALIDKKIYVSNWWKYLKQEVLQESFEYLMSEYLLPLPIDHRYSLSEMKEMVYVIKDLLC